MVVQAPFADTISAVALDKIAGVIIMRRTKGVNGRLECLLAAQAPMASSRGSGRR